MFLTLLHKTLPNQDPWPQLSSLLSFMSVSQVSTFMKTPGLCATKLAIPCWCFIICCKTAAM